MFGVTLSGKLGGLIPTVSVKKGTKVRRDLLKVHFEFTDGAAKAMELEQLREDLDEGHLNGATKSLEGKITLSFDDGDDKLDVDVLGARLTFKSLYKNDAAPKMTLDAELAYCDQTHMWLCNRLEEKVDVRAVIEPKQTEMQTEVDRRTSGGAR